jgi:hypothetical protein
MPNLPRRPKVEKSKTKHQNVKSKMPKIDEPGKSQEMSFSVIPAKAGIQCFRRVKK